PGVYLLKDGHGKVIYVGKAANLRNRVRSYLRGGDERSQVRFLVERLADFETLVTANDKEALILENNLIKQYRPRYNIRLKDDKSYVSVKVTTADPWPRVLVTRRIVKDGSRYFGPFASASAVRDTLDTIRKVFPLRTCLYREGGAIEVQVLFVRSGKLVSNRSYSFDDWEFPDEEVLEAVLTQFYQAANHDVPDEILLPVAIGDADVRAEYLSERRGKKVA